MRIIIDKLDWKVVAKAITTIQNDKRLSGLEFRLVHALIKCNPNKYFPTKNTLASQFDVSTRTIQRALNNLREYGYISTHRINHCNDNNNTFLHVHPKP